ncbi:MAG: DUF4097 family beta strand repeat protein [Clostridia bacterium]|nr:DUF4097 family beta strand repeat protein [Clostridia bacterium]
MTTLQKTIKYLAIALAIFLTFSIIGGIISALAIFSGLSGGDAVAESVRSYTVSSDVDCLDIKINAANFEIKQGEAFSVESNLKYLSVTEKSGMLVIREEKKFNGGTYTDAILTLFVPENTVFEKTSITTGAGRLSIDTLAADRLKFELGAGEVTIGTLIATSSATIEGGAGHITVSDGALHNLDLDMGVGQLDLTSALTGETELDLGVGESTLNIKGKKEDYSFDIEKGVGNITVDGERVSNLKERGNGNNKIDVSGGVGSIHMNFKD